MKNVLGKPLDALQPFIGEWTVEGRHVAFRDAVIHGRSVFEWWGERTFLVQHFTFDHPDFPDAISMIGATGPGGGLAQHYFDTRGVHRIYDMTFAGGVWTLMRTAVDAKDFDQGMRARFSADGNSITGEWKRSEPGTHELQHDLSVIFTRVNQR